MLCCGGGFSSSAMVKRIQKEIQEKHMEQDVQIDFMPFMLSEKEADNYDIIVCCPHLARDVKAYNDKYIQNKVPIYVIPPLQYGVVSANDLYEDAQDVIAAFQQNPQNPFSFPGEENIYQCKRRKSWRKTAQKK